MSDHTEGFTYDAQGRLIFRDPDGQTTLIVKGQGTSQTTYSEPTTRPVAESTVRETAGFVGAFVLTFLLGVIVSVATWGTDFIGMVLGAILAAMT